VFDVDAVSQEAPQEVIVLADQRIEARANKEWQKSDDLRDQIASLGWVVEDIAGGYNLKKA